jgi:hypothetical protein
MKKIKLKNPNAYTLKRCEIFAEFSVQSSVDEYARRNQNDVEKIKLDIYRGKVAEFMVYDYILSKDKNVTKPDLEIYDKYHKSFDSDLMSDGVNLHVKSHFVNPRFPVSWVFQKKDKLTTSAGDDYLCLVVMNENGDNWFYIQKAKLAKFEQPKKESLRASKLCIYEKSLN